MAHRRDADIIMNMDETDLDAARILLGLSGSLSAVHSNPPVIAVHPPSGRSVHPPTAQTSGLLCSQSAAPALESKQGVGAERHPSSPITPTLHRSSSRQPSSGQQCPPQSIPQNPFPLLSALMRNQEILLYLATQHIEPRELIILYRLSKPFHYLVNSRLTSFVLSSARRWARLTHFRPCNEDLEKYLHFLRNPRPRSYNLPPIKLPFREACGTEATTPGIHSPFDITTLYPFHLYGELCTPDPTLRSLDSASKAPSEYPIQYESSSNATGTKRSVPSFRYLRFLLFRARTIHSVIALMAADSHRLPIPLTPSVVAKIWLLMDFAYNKKRLAVLRDTNLWHDQDLYIAHMFFVKLDLCFTDPVIGRGEMAIRRMLIGQRTLSTLDRVLKREEGRTMIEMMILWVKVFHKPTKEHREAGYSVLGVPANEVGMMGVEAWGEPIPINNRFRVPVDPLARKALVRPDQLVLGEAVRRKLPMTDYILEMITYGYVDSFTGKPFPKTEEERIALQAHYEKERWLKMEKARGFARACAFQAAEAAAKRAIDEDDEMGDD